MVRLTGAVVLVSAVAGLSGFAAMAQVHARSRPAIGAAAQAQSRAVQRLCLNAFRGANQVTRRHTTYYNRQASVQAVACDGFGSSVRFQVDGGVVCALLAAAIGQKYRHLELYIDGSCSGAALAASHDVGSESAVACSMLSDLLSSFRAAEAYAAAAGVSCAFGQPFGSWIEAESEHQAAIGVIRKGRCLTFTTHRFPLSDTWDAVRCRRGDPGFSDQKMYPRASTVSVNASTGRIGRLRLDVSRRAAVIAFAGRPQARAVGNFGAQDPDYEALGYSCHSRWTAHLVPVGTSYCTTVFYMNRATARLAALYTASPRYVSAGGVHPGMAAAAAERLLHKNAQVGCFSGLELSSAHSRAWLFAWVDGGTIQSSPSPILVGGWVSEFDMEGRAHPVGLGFC